jgi:hypothetical protein
MRELLTLVFKMWALMKRCVRLRGALGTLSGNPFIPKPAAPLQWCATAPQRDVKGKIYTLSRESSIRLHHDSLRCDYLEVILHYEHDRAIAVPPA